MSKNKQKTLEIGEKPRMIVLSNSEKKLNKQKNNLLKLQAFARRLDRRISLEREIVQKKKMFEEIEREIQEHQKKAQLTKQQIIKHRLEKMQERRKQRIQSEKDTSKEVQKLLDQEKKKQLILNKILQKNKEDYNYCYEKALKERKQLRKPIDFQELEKHDREVRHYISKNKQIASQRYEEGSGETSKRQKSHKSSRRMARSVVDQYFQTRRKEQNRINQLKQIMKKKREYGNRVEKEYINNRAKTQNNQSIVERQQAQKKAKQINQRIQLLKEMRKPSLPFSSSNQTIAEKNQIVHIKKSNVLTSEQKLSRLTHLSNIFQNKLRLKGKSQYLDRISQINLAKAEIMLCSKDKP